MRLAQEIFMFTLFVIAVLSFYFDDNSIVNQNQTNKTVIMSNFGMNNILNQPTIFSKSLTDIFIQDKNNTVNIFGNLTQEVDSNIYLKSQSIFLIHTFPK